MLLWGKFRLQWRVRTFRGKWIKRQKAKWQECKEAIGQEDEVIVPVDKVLAFLPALHFLHSASLVVIRVGGKSNQGPERFVGGGVANDKKEGNHNSARVFSLVSPLSVRQSPTP